MTTRNQEIWQGWSGLLNRFHLSEFAAVLLEATGPLNLLGAQLVYIGQPLFSSLIPDKHLTALANLLEEPEETSAFIDFLRKEPG